MTYIRFAFLPVEFRSENSFSTNFKTQQKGEVAVYYF